MPFVHAALTPYNLATGVGIAIRRRTGQSHIGILYERGPSEINICHLGWHYLLLNRRVDTSYFWMDCPCFDDPEEATFVRSRLAAISEGTKIAYGFANDPSCFNENFVLPPRPIGWGLTCASFVLAIFEALGLNILDYSTWMRRDEDSDWQKAIIEEVAKSDPSQAQAMGDYMGRFRFRPEEVAGGAVSNIDEMPLTFDDAKTRAAEILASIVGDGPTPAPAMPTPTPALPS